MRPIGDECYTCPSCNGGTRVVNHGRWTAESIVPPYHHRMDLVRCDECGVIFAVDDWTIPKEEGE